MKNIDSLSLPELKKLQYNLKNQIRKYEVLQVTKKVQLNSAYGTLGSKYFTFFDVRLAEAITLSGQFAIQLIEKRINEFLNNRFGTNDIDYVVAGDTDSTYIFLGKYVENNTESNLEKSRIIDKICQTEIQTIIDNTLNEIFHYTNALKNRLQMKREAIASRGIWTGKKRYALDVYNNEGIEYTEPKLKITGLGIISSSMPKWAKENLQRALKLILRGTEKELNEFVKEAKTEFFTLSIYDIATGKSVGSLNYSLGDKSVPINSTGAIVYNKALRDYKLTKKYEMIQEKDSIKYCYIKQPNLFNSHVIAYKDIMPEEFKFDLDYVRQFDTVFLNQIKIMLEATPWQLNKPRGFKFK